MRSYFKIEYIIISFLIILGTLGVITISRNDKSELENNYEEAIVYLGMHVNKLLEDGDLITLNRIIKSIKKIKVAVYKNNTELLATNFDDKIDIKQIRDFESGKYKRYYRSPIFQDGILAAEVYILQPTLLSLHWKKYLILAAFIILMYSTIFLWIKKQKDVQDIKKIADFLANDEIENLNINMSSYNLYLYKELISYRKKILQLSKELKEQAEVETKINISKQVAHDIRSPLAALHMILKDFDSLPETTRLMLRNSVNRIHDIANNLLNPLDKDNNSSNQAISEQLLIPIIEEVVSEKRTALRARPSININIDATNSYGIFVKLNPSHMKRVLSNLINNSVDSFSNEKGNILISFDKINNYVAVTVSDNGKGIPKDVIPKLCKKGASFGKSDSKNSGNGLGLFHAKNSMQMWDGDLEINSEENVGTKVVLKFPILEAPSWFISQIELKHNHKVVVIDDDSSIHQIWDKRFMAYVNIKTIELIHISTPKQLEEWLNINDSNQTSFLCDYEFIGHSVNGLDLIEKLGIANKSILVTSRFDEQHIKDRCIKLGVKLIPKMMSEIAPIKFVDHFKYDLIHLDDDELIRMSWQLSAKKENKNILSYHSVEMLMRDIDTFPNTIPFYIDSSLGQNQLRGEEVAQILFNLGYKNLFISTGYDKEYFKDMPWIKDVIGKRAPFSLV